MLQKIRNFWQAFKDAFNKTFLTSPKTYSQEYADITRINFLVIFTTKLKNFVCSQSKVQVESESVQANQLIDIGEMLNKEKTKIATQILATGECIVLPSQRKDGSYYLSVLPEYMMLTAELDGGQLREAYIIVDYVRVNSQIIYLTRHHKLELNGDLIIDYKVLTENLKPTSHPNFDEYAEESTVLQGAGHIGFGWYKSPTDSRGTTERGVPLNFGCAGIEKDIFATLEQIRDEFKLSKLKLFADRSVARKKIRRDKNSNVEEVKYDVPDDVFLVDKHPGVTGSLIDTFAPNIRFSEHYSRLVELFEEYENQVGTSKGILSKSESTSGATATEIRRINADTLALVDEIRTVIDEGNKETLKAFNLLLNVPDDLFSYTSDWNDPFADPVEQWTMYMQGNSAGVIQKYRLTQWLYPNMTQEEAEAEVALVQAELIGSGDAALENALMG